ncbi:MAG: hypothetical protein EWV83_14135 [Microcystis sp. M_OC_Ca_00000000_S217Cul]|nr:MAG: hypothetical protein EWV83_14135 [Microcystis sp. M_OC_Ca_00000000_S217Cul]TRT87176.1 MAG: hypothetical protein EWV66_14650 [Microcystis sp. M_OC_Ca_00000000_C217Col]
MVRCARFRYSQGSTAIEHGYQLSVISYQLSVGSGKWGVGSGEWEVGRMGYLNYSLKLEGNKTS